MRILHLSDLHITENNYPFFIQLSDYLASTLKNEEKVSFLIVSGDLGDKCKNVDKAGDWIFELSEKLNLTTERVLICPGNHDLNTNYVHTSHSEKCLTYTSGYSYIDHEQHNYPIKAFEDFERVRERYLKSGYRPLGDGDVVEFSDENVRFIIGNSTKLSGIKNDKRIALEEGLVGLSIADSREYIEKAFNGVLCSAVASPVSDAAKNMLPPSYNFSENTRQQINHSLSNKINTKCQDGKMNIMIIHHPEFCFHYLQRFELPKVPNSGAYFSLSTLCDFQICGHIHPNASFSTNKSHLNIPHLVGGKCNPVADTKEQPKERPLFYLYDLQDNKQQKNEIVCKRTSYRYREENGNFFFTQGPELPRSTFTTTTRETSRKYETTNINSEIAFETVTSRFANSFIGFLEGFLKKSSLDFEVTKHGFWHAASFDPNPHYHIYCSGAHEISIQGKYKIYIDFFPSHLLVIPNYLACRVEKNSLQLDEHSLYLPVVIDSLLHSIDDHELRSTHFEKVKQSIINFYQSSKYPRTNLEVFLVNNIKDLRKDIKFPQILKISKCIFLGFNLINELLLNENINFESREFTKENTILELNAL